VKTPIAGSRVLPAFEKRAARAEELAHASETASQPLRFAAGLYRAQGRMAARLETLPGELGGRLDLDAPRIAPFLAEVLGFVARAGPGPLADEARSRSEEDATLTCERLLVCWRGERETAEDYLSRALLRPYVEVLASAGVSPKRSHRQGRCPFCGGAPWIAARRPEPESDAARRLLACCLCGGEWVFYRIRCPCCGEDGPEKLPSFGSDAYPEARIDACETCRRYVKSIDMTQDARPIPEVDDLRSLGLDLWAAEAGFTRIEPGLAGL
jgi:hypothetical protein